MTSNKKNLDKVVASKTAERRIDLKTREHFYSVQMNNDGAFELRKTHTLYPDRRCVVDRTRNPAEARHWVEHGEALPEDDWHYDREGIQQKRVSLAKGLDVRKIPDHVSVEGRSIPNGYCLTFLSASVDRFDEVYIMKGNKEEAHRVLVEEYGAEPLLK